MTPTTFHEAEKQPGRYAFQVGREGWTPLGVAQLPHSCNEWVIGEDRDKATVIRDFEAFLVEAHNALDRLRAMP